MMGEGGHGGKPYPRGLGPAPRRLPEKSLDVGAAGLAAAAGARGLGDVLDGGASMLVDDLPQGGRGQAEAGAEDGCGGGHGRATRRVAPTWPARGAARAGP